jgi:tyrosinase
MRVRQDVWDLSDEDPWHPVLEWYARGVAELRARDGDDFSDPTCWRYLAAIHGAGSEPAWPQGATWNRCEHWNWFFLPWHRVYLHYFEKAVRGAVVQLGGPDDWALPYWNYSDPQKPGRRAIPPAFRARTLPSGEDNPLFTDERNTDMNEGDQLHPHEVDLGGSLRTALFAGPSDGIPTGFGGTDAGAGAMGGSMGTLEKAPHGSVHMGVGGWMGAFNTAGFDPLFWLHHANIDRLWEAWLAGMPGASNPDTPRWLDQSFDLGQGEHAVAMRVRDVLDTAAEPLGYQYASIDLPATAAGNGVFTAAAPTPEDAVPHDFPPEMVGANDHSVPLTTGTTSTRVPVSSPTGAMAAAVEEGVEPKIYLRIENVTGQQPASSTYLVHVNVPQGDDPAAHPELSAGRITTFGVAEASDRTDEHGGSGISFTLDITPVARLLLEKDAWVADEVAVTFTPVRPSGTGESDLRVGRVSVYYA